VTAITSGSVLLCLFAAKRWLWRRRKRAYSPHNPIRRYGGSACRARVCGWNKQRV